MSEDATDHAAHAAHLLKLWHEDAGTLTDVQRWEYLAAAQSHAMLAMHTEQQNGVAVLMDYRVQLADALEVDRQRLAAPAPRRKKAQPKTEPVQP